MSVSTSVNKDCALQVSADTINDISAYASDQDKFSPGAPPAHDLESQYRFAYGFIFGPAQVEPIRPAHRQMTVCCAGRAGSTFGSPEAASKGDTSKEAQFTKSAGDGSRDTSGSGVSDIGNTVGPQCAQVFYHAYSSDPLSCAAVTQKTSGFGIYLAGFYHLYGRDSDACGAATRAVLKT